jgi:predicted phosphodiesterase
MGTLVVSDLHLGAQTRRDLLRSASVRGPLVEKLAGVSRLVLLGDVVELRHGPVRDALSTAREALEALGAAVGADGEIVIVPGNHDHHLLDAWLERRSRSRPPERLRLCAQVAWQRGEPLASIARFLEPARVRACYPGVWLRDDVYATHGHYCDRHTTVPMLERLGAGVMARLVRDHGPSSAEDYERVLAPIYSWINAVAQWGGPELGESSHGASAQAWRALAGSGSGRRRRPVRRRAVIAAFPAAVRLMNRLGLGPLQSDVSAVELRRAGLRAFGEVCARLSVDASWVVFGHTHRAGPLPDDDRSEWLTPAGGALINSGCWVHEPGFLGRDPRNSPYRAGFCVWVPDEVGRPPELLNLLD